MRRNLSHAFSDKALRSQEILIQGFVDLLIHRLDEYATKNESVDIMRMYNYATFDIISDLAFGEPLYCLRDNQYHEWVELTFATIKSFGITSTRDRYAFFKWFDKIRSLFTDNKGLTHDQDK